MDSGSAYGWDLAAESQDADNNHARFSHLGIVDACVHYCFVYRMREDLYVSS